MSDTLLIEPDPDVRAAHVCPECERFFATKAGLGTHRAAAHGVPGSSAETERKRKREPRQPKVREPGVKERVLGFYQLLADVWAIRDPQCAEALRQSAPQAAEMWAQLAKQHAWVAKFWSDLAGAAGWPGLLAAHMPLLLSVSAHHIQPAMAARRAAALGGEEEVYGNGQGAYAEAPAG